MHRFEFSLRTLLVAMTLIAIAIALLIPFVQSAKWVGHTHLEVCFLVVDAETDRPIPNATVHIRAERGGFCEDRQPRQFTLTTDASGFAKHMCQSCMCFGSQGIVEDTYAVHLPWWWFHATADGYSGTAPTHLASPDYQGLVQRGRPFATIVVPIGLRRIATERPD